VTENQLPLNIYPPQNDWDKRFNEDLTKSLQNTRIYCFRGPTAVHCAVRLRYRAQVAEPRDPAVDVKIVITDPTSPQAVERVVRDRLTRPGARGRAETEIRRDVVRDIHKTVVALFHCRQFCDSIELVYEAGTADTRVELFDDAAYETHLSSARSTKFPEIVSYERSHSRYRFLLDDFNFVESAPLDERHVIFYPDSDQSVLEKFLRSSWEGSEDISAAITRLEKEYRTKYYKEWGEQMVELDVWSRDAVEAILSSDQTTRACG